MTHSMITAMHLLTLLTAAGFALVGQCAAAATSKGSQAQTLTVSTSSTRKSNFGVAAFIENNINYGTDGGIYAELIRNRAFQDGGNSTQIGTGNSKYYFTTDGASIDITHANKLSEQLPTSIYLSRKGSSDSYGLRNVGFFGVPVQKQAYNVSFYARTDKEATLNFTAGLYDPSGKNAFAQSSFAASVGSQWKQYTTTISCDQSSQSLNNTFGLDIAASGTDSPTVQLNLISMFPPTWEGTIARKDLAQAIADLKPVYFRLPGGNSLEGNSLPEHFVWNNTVGPLTQRQGRLGTWAGWDTDGYGLNQAYQLFSKMGAKPVLGVFTGLTLNDEVVPQAKLQPYVDSVKNELHYVLDAPGTSKWAAMRVQDGQEEPWEVPYVEAGNEDYLLENGNITYNEYRYAAFSQAIEEAAPKATVVSTSPYYRPKSQLKAIDQHDYNVPNNLIGRWDERDSWPRNGTQVFELEFSVLNSGLCSNNSDIYTNPCRLKVPTLIGAVAEATFMMGLERNGDITPAAAYAPLFDRADHSQWTPDLIKFNALEVVKSTSYYVQQAFGHNRIDLSHNVTSSQKPGPVYWSVGSSGIGGKAYSIKLSNVENSSQDVRVQLDSGSKGGFSSNGGSLWVMSGNDRQAGNDIGKANVVVPVTRPLTPKDFDNGALKLTLPANSFAVASVSAA